MAATGALRALLVFLRLDVAISGLLARTNADIFDNLLKKLTNAITSKCLANGASCVFKRKGNGLLSIGGDTSNIRRPGKPFRAILGRTYGVFKAESVVRQKSNQQQCHHKIRNRKSAESYQSASLTDCGIYLPNIFKN